LVVADELIAEAAGEGKFGDSKMSQCERSQHKESARCAKQALQGGSYQKDNDMTVGRYRF
jgi:hypothetical protein